MKQKRSIFEYKNYREFLRDRFEELKQSNKKFSYRYFSKEAGFRSQSVLKQVMNGQINIAPKSIEKYVKALKLNNEEAFYFEHLVLLNQAKTPEETTLHAEEILKSRKFKELYPLSEFQMNYFRNWYYVPVRELVGLQGFREDPQWMAKVIQPSIKPEEVQKALFDLEQLKLITRDGSGRLVQSHQDVSTGDTVISELVRSYHREMIKKGAEAIDLYARHLRDITAVVLSVSNQDLPELKSIISQFRKNIMKLAAQNMNRNQLYQLNIQFFPLTVQTDEEKK